MYRSLVTDSTNPVSVVVVSVMVSVGVVVVVPVVVTVVVVDVTTIVVVAVDDCVEVVCVVSATSLHPPTMIVEKKNHMCINPFRNETGA